MEKLEISLIHSDIATQPRVRLNQKLIDEYAEAITLGDHFPPVTVFNDGTHYWLADGFHRLEAAKKIAAFTINVDVRQGTQRDAILYSVGANATHGLKRSNTDKRRSVLKLLSDPEWSQWSNNEVAKQCCVAEGLVRKLKLELSSYSTKIDQTYARKCGVDEGILKKLQQKLLTQSSECTAQRAGTTYTISTANIGGKNTRANFDSEYFEVCNNFEQFKSNDNELKHFINQSLEADSPSKVKINDFFEKKLKANVRILSIKQEDNKQLEKITQIFEVNFSGIHIQIEGCPDTLMMLFQEMQNNPDFLQEVLQQVKFHRLAKV